MESGHGFGEGCGRRGIERPGEGGILGEKAVAKAREVYG
jgi:hypothetical protein